MLLLQQPNAAERSVQEIYEILPFLKDLLVPSPRSEVEYFVVWVFTKFKVGKATCQRITVALARRGITSLTELLQYSSEPRYRPIYDSLVSLAYNDGVWTIHFYKYITAVEEIVGSIKAQAFRIDVAHVI